MSDNYLKPYHWHQMFYYCKSTFFGDMHICLRYDNYSAYYASIMLDAFRHLLCSKLCQLNRLVPTVYTIFITSKRRECTNVTYISAQDGINEKHRGSYMYACMYVRHVALGLISG